MSRDRRSSKHAVLGPLNVNAAASRRPQTSGARSDLIEATARVMRDDGYAAATSRRVAAEAGVKQALVYYYFPTMDDLFVEVLRAGAEASLDDMRAALTNDDPLGALWTDQQRFRTRPR